MGITKFPAGISSQGVPVIGGSYYTTGTVFFVDSTTGSNGNSGTDKDHPFSTIDYAIGRCTGDKGDVIIVMPNHTETVTSATALALDVAGINIIGLGSAGTRPLITLTTATTASINVDADDITLKNFRIDLTGVDAVALGIDVNAAGFTMEDCDIEVDDTGGQAVLAMDIAGVDNVTVRHCCFHGIGSSAHSPVATHAINVSATGCDFLTIEDNYFSGWFLTAVMAATKDAEGMLIQNNVFINWSDTGAGIIDLGSTTTSVYGAVRYNDFSTNSSGTWTTVVVGDVLGKTSAVANYVTHFGQGKSGALCPELTEAHG